MKRVILESPYAGDVNVNEIYAELCMYDCLVNYHEAPYASHLLYTRKYVLNDDISNERELGINAGFAWRGAADLTVFYIDLGVSEGMRRGIADCEKYRRSYVTRNLPKELWDEFMKICDERSE